ncbi:hypothetical protein ACA910_009508 [Epithemia clementina (nom. ined.)]
MNVQVFENVLEEDYFAILRQQQQQQQETTSNTAKGEELPCTTTTTTTLTTTSTPQLIGAIDQGTSSTRFLVFTKQGRIAAYAQDEHEQIYHDHQAGWHEHDPLEIFEKTVACIHAVGDVLRDQHGLDLNLHKLVALGITNQRETTLAWNQETGIPYANAIVWDDTRTQTTAEQIAQGNRNRLRDATGLPLASYFAGTKVKWLLDHCPELQRDLADPIQRQNVRFGTMDTWLIYQLSGTPAAGSGHGRRTTKRDTTPQEDGSDRNEAAAAVEDEDEDPPAINKGGLFCTDVTNASRWLFMNLHTLQWDQDLVQQVCAPHDLPYQTCLPKICPSAHIFGHVHPDSGVDYLANVPIAAVLGDQQAALFGQTAFRPGEAKNTYGTGLFLIMNTGTKVPQSQNLLSTVAYQLGPDQPVHYALEGSVSHSGSTIQWLRDQLQIIPSAPDSEAMATLHNDGLYLVPAFAGLFAPHWRSDARACLVGLTTAHHKGHVCRAALEASAYQTREVFETIRADSGVELQALKVDGGGTTNNLLMQFQADMLNVPVVKPKIKETTSLGVAFCAGLAVGVYRNLDEIKSLWAVSKTYLPRMSPEERHKNWNGWNKAVSRSLGWIDTTSPDCDHVEEDDDESYTTSRRRRRRLAHEHATHHQHPHVPHNNKLFAPQDPNHNTSEQGEAAAAAEDEEEGKVGDGELRSLAYTSCSSFPSSFRDHLYGASTVLLCSAVGLAVGAFIGSSTSGGGHRKR